MNSAGSADFEERFNNLDLVSRDQGRCMGRPRYEIHFWGLSAFVMVRGSATFQRLLRQRRYV